MSGLVEAPGRSAGEGVGAREGVGGRSPGRIPDFFIVGNPKSGTTALYEMLRGHPQIYMPDLKEPMFFASELPRRAHRYRVPGTLDEYLDLFAGASAGQLVGEASASYLWSRAAAGAIAEVAPGARIVAILREPASFLRSLHLQCLQSQHESERDLRRALALEGARREGRRIPRRSRWPQVLLYSEHVRYVEQLERYRARFTAERMLILIYDDFRRDNVATVRRVLGFLGVDEERPVQPLEANPTVTVRSAQLDDLVHDLSTGAGPLAAVVKASVKALTPERLRRRALRELHSRVLLGEPPPLDERLARELRLRYQPEVLALSEYLGRDLVSLWGYDQLA